MLNEMAYITIASNATHTQVHLLNKYTNLALIATADFHVCENVYAATALLTITMPIVSAAVVANATNVVGAAFVCYISI